MEDEIAVPLPELPSEILCFVILPRLPAKSLMRFRSVSKHWSSLTRNPSFVAAHHHHHNNTAKKNILLGMWDEAGRHQHLHSLQIDLNNPTHAAPATHLLTLSSTSSTRDPYKIQRINGLICLNYHYQAHPHDPHCDRFIHVLNPTTRELLTLLQPSSPANHPAIMSHHFGFSPLTNEYKILQVVRYFLERPPRTIIFKVLTLVIGSSSTSTTNINHHHWRSIEVTDDHLLFPLTSCFLINQKSVCIHGAIHWTYMTTLPLDPSVRIVLVVFDVAKEIFRTILVPKDCLQINAYQQMTEVDGCVGMIYVDHHRERMELWILKDYNNEEWVMETIEFPSHWRELGRPVDFGRNINTGGEAVLLKMGTSDNGIRVYLYNIKSRSFISSEIVLPESVLPREGDKNILQAFISYEESIVPL